MKVCKVFFRENELNRKIKRKIKRKINESIIDNNSFKRITASALGNPPARMRT
jgi:hypothetical protein